MTDQKLGIGSMFGKVDPAAGFLGFPRVETLGGEGADIALLGAPCASPYASVGAYCAGAPQAIRAGVAGYGMTRHHHDFDLGGPILPDPACRVVDLGDLPYDETDAPANRARIRDQVGQILAGGGVPVVLGGDDSIPTPVFQAYEDHGEGRGPFTVLQIDAHIDWRDEVQGERWGLSSTMRRASEMAWIEHIVQVGARAGGSARPGDYADAKAWGVDFILARQVHAEGLAAAIEAVPAGAEVLVSLDVDGLDPSIMPAVIGPSPGGLMHWQLLALLHGVAAKARIAGFCLVEFMPGNDPFGHAALTAGRLVCNAIGLIARQRAKTL